MVAFEHPTEVFVIFTSFVRSMSGVRVGAQDEPTSRSEESSIPAPGATLNATKDRFANQV